jgi:hypothetical protein
MAFVNAKTEDGGVDLKAEFIISMTWDKETIDDIDLYIEDPLGNICFFRARESGFMSLERDDTGASADTFTTSTGEVILYKNNNEKITIRAIIPGEYVINAHLYTKRGTEENDGPRKAQVVIKKLNPKISIVGQKDIELLNTGDEVTVFRMILNKDGTVKEVNELFKNLANKNGTKLDYAEEHSGEEPSQVYKNGFENAQPPSEEDRNSY